MGNSSFELDLVDSLKSFSSLTTARPSFEELFAALCDALEIEHQNLRASISARLVAIVLTAGMPLLTDGDGGEGRYVVCAGRLPTGMCHFSRGGVIVIGMPSGGTTHNGTPVARRVSIVIKISHDAFETRSREYPEAALALVRTRLAQAATQKIGGTLATRPHVIGRLHAMGVHGPAPRAFIASCNPIGDFHALPLPSLAGGARARKVTHEGVLRATATMIGVEDTSNTLFCLSTNFSAAREAPLTRGVLDAAILASFAIPGVMPPVLIDGHLHIEGGCMNNLPIDVMRRLGAGRIIAVEVTSHAVRTCDAVGVPGPWTMLLSRLRGGKRPGMPGRLHMILQAPIIQSVSRQAGQHAGTDLMIAPAVRGLGLQGWKKMDRAITAGFNATLEVLGGVDLLEFWASRGAPASVPQ